MEYTVRRLAPEELERALELAWDTFLRFEAPDCGPLGVETFRRDIMDNVQFHDNCRSGSNRMWGALDGDKLIGIFVMRGISHICLVFTHHAYHRQGIATAIFRKLLKDVRGENPQLCQLTLNSSPYGKNFYRHVGFCDTDEEKTINGIRFTPMVYVLK